MNDEENRTTETVQEEQPARSSRRTSTTAPTEPDPVSQPITPADDEEIEAATVREELQPDDDGNVPVQRSGGGADNRVPADQTASSDEPTE